MLPCLVIPAGSFDSMMAFYLQCECTKVETRSGVGSGVSTLCGIVKCWPTGTLETRKIWGPHHISCQPPAHLHALCKASPGQVGGDQWIRNTALELGWTWLTLAPAAVAAAATPSTLACCHLPHSQTHSCYCCSFAHRSSHICTSGTIGEHHCLDEPDKLSNRGGFDENQIRGIQSSSLLGQSRYTRRFLPALETVPGILTRRSLEKLT